MARAEAAPEASVLRAALLERCPAASGDGRVNDLIRFALNAGAGPPDIGSACAPFVQSIGRLRQPDPTRNPKRSMPGVAACEADVERGFRRLLGRYDAAGGLTRIYEMVRA
jgi:hypothetical protein